MTKKVIANIREIVKGLSEDLNRVRISVLTDAIEHNSQTKTIDDQVLAHKCAIELENSVAILRTNILDLIEREINSFGSSDGLRKKKGIYSSADQKKPLTQKRSYFLANRKKFVGRSVKRLSKTIWHMKDNKIICMSRKGNKSVPIESIRKMWSFFKQVEFFNFTDLINLVRKSTKEDSVTLDGKLVPTVLGHHALLAIRFLDSFSFVKRLRKSKEISGKRLFRVCDKTNRELDEVFLLLGKS